MLNMSIAQKPRVLVVEDDTNLLEGIRTVLELDGYAVETAENGRDALERLRSDHPLPELIVSDIMMPYMSGIDLLTEVRRESRWVNIPFIFLTARGDKAHVQLSKQLGVDDYLIKPFDAPDLLIAIEARLKRQKAINDAASGAMTDLKQRILTILNHEFRTPLTFIVAYADMLNNTQSYELSDEEILTFLKGVNSGAMRLRRLIENFIQLVEIETGDAIRNYKMRRAQIDDITPVLKDAIKDVLSDGVQHTIDIQLEPDLPLFPADPQYLRSAIIQLLDNAIKFSLPSQPITLGVKRSNLSNGDPAICIYVQDKGRGIPPAERDRIWESFYQIDRKFYEDQGTGSGLAIVRAIAQLHRGEVDLTSIPNQGSTFFLLLPLHAE